MLIIRANVRMQRKYKQALFSLTKSIINKTVDVPNVDIQNFVGHKASTLRQLQLYKSTIPYNLDDTNC